MYQRLKTAYDNIRTKTNFNPEVGIVLGSGLGDFAKNIQVETAVPYSSIQGFPVSTVAGHKGQFIFGFLEGVPIVAMQGRVHYYEGYSMEDVVLPVRLMSMMKIRALILTNAAGGVNTSFSEGTLMAISDHIMLAPNPLIGKNIDTLGARFPDMTTTYDKRLFQLVKDSAKAANVALKEGVYIQFTGPSYETPAEIKMARLLGADAVGMSTACEAVAANHCGVKVCGISCITNMAAGVTGNKLTHEEVSEVAARVQNDFVKLILNVVKSIKKTDFI